jgi:hypothetical protein
MTIPAGLLLGGLIGLVLANGPLPLVVRPAPAARQLRGRAVRWLGLYAAGSALCLAPLLLILHSILLPLGCLAGVFGIVRVWLVRRGQDRSLGGQLVGAAAMSLAGPAGPGGPAGAWLWLLLWLFFASGVFFVRMRVRAMIAARKGTGGPGAARSWCVAYHLLLIALLPGLSAAGVIPWPVLWAFAPAVWRAARGLRPAAPRLALRRLGWSEAALTAAFVAVLVYAF